MLGGEPADHEQTHVPGAVGADLAAGLQTHVGHAPVGVGHAQTDVDDLQQDQRRRCRCTAETRTGDVGGE